MGAENTRREVLTDGLVREELVDDEIIVYTISSTEQAVIDTLVSDFERYFRVSNADAPFFYIADVSDITLTPYMRTAVSKLVAAYPRGAIVGAVIPPKSHVARLFRVFAMQIMTLYRGVDVRFFFDRQASLDWLRQKQDRSGSQSGK